MTRFGIRIVFGAGLGTVVLGLGLWIAGMCQWRAVFVALNVVVMLCQGWDKLLARRGEERIPESVLHLLAAAGGTPGSVLGQLLFRHKTRDLQFRLVSFGIAVAQGVLLHALGGMQVASAGGSL